jgi:fucose permease
VLGLLLTAWSPTYAILLWANFVLGFGAGVLDMVLSPIVSAINPESRSASMNWLHSFYCVGATLTVMAGTIALQCNVSWRMACLLLIPLPALLIFALGRS